MSWIQCFDVVGVFVVVLVAIWSWHTFRVETWNTTGKMKRTHNLIELRQCKILCDNICTSILLHQLRFSLLKDAKHGFFSNRIKSNKEINFQLEREKELCNSIEWFYVLFGLSFHLHFTLPRAISISLSSICAYAHHTRCFSLNLYCS